ncbi:MAG: hypothetical protein ACRC33_28855 [Gemmataceae bacterium]
MDPITFRAETPLQALILEHALAMARQLEHTAGNAAHGRVLAAVESFAVPAGRELTRKAVEAALQAQADPVEKKLTRPASAPAGPGA